MGHRPGPREGSPPATPDTCSTSTSRRSAVSEDGGGWRAHGRGSDQDRANGRAKTAGAPRGYTYLHSVIDGYSRLACTEPLPDEKATTVVAFTARARAWFAAHGITHVTRVVTDNGSAYRSKDFATATRSRATRHQRTAPYTPRHNGKVERYHQILAEEVLYARPYASETERAQAITTWNIHDNYHRPHTTCQDQPPSHPGPRPRHQPHAQQHLVDA